MKSEEVWQNIYQDQLKRNQDMLSKLHTEYFSEVLQYQNEFDKFKADFKIHNHILKSKKLDVKAYQEMQKDDKRRSACVRQLHRNMQI